jgi:hypothetical protein
VKGGVKGVSGLAIVFWGEGSNLWVNADLGLLDEFDEGFTIKAGAEDDVGGKVGNLGSDGSLMGLLKEGACGDGVKSGLKVVPAGAVVILGISRLGLSFQNCQWQLPRFQPFPAAPSTWSISDKASVPITC